MSRIMRYLPVSSNITTLQATTYLVAVCLFSISFLVFLNSSISFVITDLLDIRHSVGDLVGTLGFADELVAIVACPFWGIVSDKLGVRWVCTLGYAIVGVSLMVLVQSNNVYPQLLLARMGFSIGGAATATMVTAILPSITGSLQDKKPAGIIARRSEVPDTLRHSITPSVDSQLTITPELYSYGRTNQRLPETVDETHKRSNSSPPRLAGLVGLATGCGALLALALFLPLPARFSAIDGMTQGQAVADSFYVVGVIALVVSLCCFIGLRNLQGEDDKGWATLLGAKVYDRNVTQSAAALPYWTLLFDSTLLGFQDAQIGLGYIGGFVARASSVGISLFIPLYINAYFISNGFCKGSPTDPSPELKKECRAAYILSAELTGASQLVALLCAPLFGYLSDRYRRYNAPLLVASGCGIIGYTAFAWLPSPELKNEHNRGGSPIVFFVVALIGISQIGAIVCSLGLLGRGVLGAESGNSLSSQLPAERAYASAAEAAPLLDDDFRENSGISGHADSRSHLKGSIAGVYSLSGGAAILLLTKLGGYLFDTSSRGAPFYMMATFNAILLLVGIGNGVYGKIKAR